MNTWINYSLEGCFFGFHALVCALICRNGLRRTPWLFAYAACTCSLTMAVAVLQFLPTHRLAWWNTHYIGNGILSLLMLAVILETVRAVPLLHAVPAGIRVFCFALTLALTATTTLPALHQARSAAMYYTETADVLNRAVCVAWAVYGLSLFAWVAVIGHGWTTLPLRIAQGAMWQVAVQIVAVYAQHSFPANRALVSNACDALGLMAPLYWSAALHSARVQVNHERHTLRSLPSLIPTAQAYE